MYKRRRSLRKFALLALVAWMAILVAMPAAPAVEGPWLDIERPDDGELFTTKTVKVEGTATPPLRSMEIEGVELFGGDLSNLDMVDGNLRFRPTNVFSDDFSGPGLDVDKWTILVDPANVSVEGGLLKLTYLYAYPYIQESIPLVISKAFSPPEGADMEAEYEMRFATYGYSGSAGGISDGHTDPYKSHLAVYNYYQAYGTPIFRVWADGNPVHNKSTYDLNFHQYNLDYSSIDELYTCSMNGNNLIAYERENPPTHFYFGKGEDCIIYPYPIAASIEVNYVETWATSGMWVSYPFELDNEMVFEGADISYTSTENGAAELQLEIRFSEDLESWTDWVPFGEDGDLETPLNGTNIQLRLRMGLPGVHKANARVVVDRIDLQYRDPLTSVEVRRQGGEWVPADGLEEWSVDLALVEDENTIEVRATDVGGAVNITSVSVVVDTTPPVGTMRIKGDTVYTNDAIVTLKMNATDKWGVEFVEVSNWEDFEHFKRFPYTEEVDWTIGEAEGLNHVYARFVDSHGLVSQAVSDSIVYDTFPPSGSILIDDGLLYTSQLTVQLTLEYDDLNEIESVVLSNDPDFADPWVVPMGVKTKNNWDLAEGGDGVRTVHMRVVDMAGNVRESSDSIELYIPKHLGGITINGGDDLTGLTVVELDIVVPYDERPRLMQFANEPTFAGSDWVSIAENHMWILEPGDGTRTVYVRFLDKRDIVSLPVNDTIRLDTSPPTVEVTLDGGAKYTTDTSVEVRVAINDASDPVKMWLARDDTFDRIKPQGFEAEFNWTVPARESDHMVYVRVEDTAGNVGQGSTVIHYASISPTIVLALPEGDVTSTTDIIPVNITPTDPYGGIEVQVVFDDDPNDADPWEPLTGTVHLLLPAWTKDGAYEINARARNAAGLVSKVVSIEVVLDTLAPSLAIVYPEDGSIIPQKGLDVRLEIMAADATRILRIAYVVDGGEEREMPTDLLRTNITLDSFGDHTIEVMAEDEAGNVARGTSTFTLEDSEARASGVNILPLMLLVLMAGAGAAAYGMHRSRSPGLRNVRLDDADGWDEEFTHPTLSGEVEAAEAGLEAVDVPTEEAPVPEPQPPDEVQLEEISLPPDLEATTPEERAPGSGWKEI